MTKTPGDGELKPQNPGAVGSKEVEVCLLYTDGQIGEKSSKPWAAEEGINLHDKQRPSTSLRM